MSESYYSDRYFILKEKVVEKMMKQKKLYGYTNFSSVLDSAFHEAELAGESRITYTRSLRKEPEIKELLKIEQERQKRKESNPELRQVSMSEMLKKR